jgi:hypothetical protein
MAIAGWALVIIGMAAVIVGIVGGAKEIFAQQNEGVAMGLLPTKLLEVLAKLLDAPRDKMLFVGGILLIFVGLALNGVQLAAK